MNVRFIAAMSCYAGLAALAGFTLDGQVRLVTWIILGLFALKTWLSDLKRRMD